MPYVAHTWFPREVAGQVHVASALPRSFSGPDWSFSYLAGKLVEVRSAVAAAGLTAGIGLVQEAQDIGETWSVGVYGSCPGPGLRP